MDGKHSLQLVLILFSLISLSFQETRFVVECLDKFESDSIINYQILAAGVDDFERFANVSLCVQPSLLFGIAEHRTVGCWKFQVGTFNLEAFECESIEQGWKSRTIKSLNFGFRFESIFLKTHSLFSY